MMCGFIFICALVGIVFANGIVYYVTKVYTVDKICSHPELSDEKVDRCLSINIFFIQYIISQYFYFKLFLTFRLIIDLII